MSRGAWENGKKQQQQQQPAACYPTEIIGQELIVLFKNKEKK